MEAWRAKRGCRMNARKFLGRARGLEHLQQLDDFDRGRGTLARALGEQTIEEIGKISRCFGSEFSRVERAPGDQVVHELGRLSLGGHWLLAREQPIQDATCGVQVSTLIDPRRELSGLLRGAEDREPRG